MSTSFHTHNVVKFSTMSLGETTFHSTINPRLVIYFVQNHSMTARDCTTTRNIPKSYYNRSKLKTDKRNNFKYHLRHGAIKQNK